MPSAYVFTPCQNPVPLRLWAFQHRDACFYHRTRTCSLGSHQGPAAVEWWHVGLLRTDLHSVVLWKSGDAFHIIRSLFVHTQSVAVEPDDWLIDSDMDRVCVYSFVWFLIDSFIIWTVLSSRLVRYNYNRLIVDTWYYCATRFRAFTLTVLFDQICQAFTHFVLKRTQKEHIINRKVRWGDRCLNLEWCAPLFWTLRYESLSGSSAPSTRLALAFCHGKWRMFWVR